MEPDKLKMRPKEEKPFLYKDMTNNQNFKNNL